MADKHTITLEALREYDVDLTISRKVEFHIVSLDTPIDAKVLEDYAARRGWQASIEILDGLYLSTLTAHLFITEEIIRQLSEDVERFCRQHGWDYDGWEAFTYK
jgi:hypothetical protein